MEPDFTNGREREEDFPEKSQWKWSGVASSVSCFEQPDPLGHAGALHAASYATRILNADAFLSQDVGII